MAYLKTKLQHEINARTSLPFIYHLKNIKINKKTVGCAGFIENTCNGKLVYVSTEHTLYHTSTTSQCRPAKNLNDYIGHNVTYTSDSKLADAIIKLLT